MRRSSASGARPTVDRPDTPDLHVTAVRRLPAVAAQYAPFPDALDARLTRALASRGIAQLYTHQAEAIDHALAGRNVVVITPTASGKTLCYNAPVLNAILQDPSSRALYLFPTKALAQDQLAELQALCETLAAATGDADRRLHLRRRHAAGRAARRSAARAHVVLSNPDMVHSGILPHHPRWAKLFENLRYVIIDELHAYRGVFGSHLCNVLRRLRRICRHYGSNPVFLCSSATIANPRELAERLTEQPFELVEQSGAPRGEKFFVFVNPPVVNQQLGIRRSYLGETRRIASEFLKRNLQLIVFAQSRLSTEILTTYLKDDFEGAPGAPERIRGYRGGYLPHAAPRDREGPARRRGARRRLDQRARARHRHRRARRVGDGRLSGHDRRDVAARRAARAAASSRSAAVLVASSAPLDQFVVRNPSYFFDASPERALIDPDNLHILVDHVKCAAFELPFTGAEAFGRHDVQEILGAARRAGPGASGGRAGRRGASWTWTNESYPADAVSLRSVSSDNFVDRRHDATRRASSARPISRAARRRCTRRRSTSSKGSCIQVERLDFDGRKAFVRAIDCDYYTDAITYTQVTPHRHVRQSEPRRRPSASHGEVHVVSRVVGFKKIKFYTNENVGSGELDLPEQQMHTTSYWLTIPAAVMARAAVRVRRSPRRRRRARVRDAAGRAAAADVRRPRHRHLDRQRRAGESESESPKPIPSPQDLHLRQLPRRHRLQRSRCSACTTSCSTARGG